MRTGFIEKTSYRDNDIVVHPFPDCMMEDVWIRDGKSGGIYYIPNHMGPTVRGILGKSFSRAGNAGKGNGNGNGQIEPRVKVRYTGSKNTYLCRFVLDIRQEG